jgi:hypothetical protein
MQMKQPSIMPLPWGKGVQSIILISNAIEEITEISFSP